MAVKLVWVLYYIDRNSMEKVGIVMTVKIVFEFSVETLAMRYS